MLARDSPRALTNRINHPQARQRVRLRQNRVVHQVVHAVKRPLRLSPRRVPVVPFTPSTLHRLQLSFQRARSCVIARSRVVSPRPRSRSRRVQQTLAARPRRIVPRRTFPTESRRRSPDDALRPRARVARNALHRVVDARALAFPRASSRGDGIRRGANAPVAAWLNIARDDARDDARCARCASDGRGCFARPFRARGRARGARRRRAGAFATQCGRMTLFRDSATDGPCLSDIRVLVVSATDVSTTVFLDGVVTINKRTCVFDGSDKYVNGAVYGVGVIDVGGVDARATTRARSRTRAARRAIGFACFDAFARATRGRAKTSNDGARARILLTRLAMRRAMRRVADARRGVGDETDGGRRSRARRWR